MVMIRGAGGEEMARWEKGDGGGSEERILVSVRLRPLNAKEIERNDPAEWECINDTTVFYKQSLPERSLFPQAYTFDRVFGKECNTKHVYLDGAKEVALAVVSGINASIFAYGQTSSGKTYTMSGITEYTVEDIYEYINRHAEREFVLKFSAMEIYNEAVRDLLSADTAPLRLLDDPERGTVVEKLIEETPRDQWHLKELLEICAAQRQVGETALNEMSSRSHQILRLTIASTAKEFKDKGSSSTLFAAVNFVDLAGSERASQVSSGGNRLKEGCHINRSLLTLGTVIRKLSKGRTGHIPYRDSKLTRILQPFLGGNARTAIICTMSPARSHIEQSRNTLLFASCAKEVVTNAQVNVVMSDKALVKHLQRELARLENEMKHPGLSTCTEHSDALKDKDAQINKMERQIKELMRQRDLAQSRLDDMLQVVVDDQPSRQWEVSSQASRQWEVSSQSSASNTRSECEDTLSTSGASSTGYQNPHFRSSSFDTPEDFSGHQIELRETPKPPRCSISSPSLNKLIAQDEGKEIAEGRHEDPGEQCKEVQCIEMHAMSPARRSGEVKLTGEDKLEDFASKSEADKIEILEQDLVKSRDLALNKSRSCKASLMDGSLMLSLPEDDGRQVEDTSVEVLLEESTEKPEVIEVVVSELNVDEKNKEPSVEGLEASEEVNSNNMIEAGGAENAHEKVDSNEITPSGMNDEGENNHLEHQEQVSSGMNDEGESNHQKQLSSDEETHQTQLETHEDCVDDATPCSLESPPSEWKLEFQGKQQEIIQLWQICNVPLVHRTCFFLLFKGEPADCFYMEVEFRRLSFLKNTFSSETAGDIMTDGSHNFDLNSSLRCLRRERDMLCKQMQRTMTPKERESLYTEWGIDLNSKQRRLQLTQLIWTKTAIEHVRASASAIAKVIGFVERGQGQGMKEMVGLCLTPPRAPRRSFTWRPIRSASSLR